MPQGRERKQVSKTMTYDEALEYIHSVSWLGSRPGLERTVRLCSLAGDPQKNLKFVHVAGTNGKGSFTAMLSSILKSAGLKVGCFTSPYVYTFNERFTVDQDPISNDELAEVTEYIKGFADTMTEQPTEFELITVIGFEYFKRSGCDIVILEAGMGGRLDSTNVIDHPELAVITGIALDHTSFLGSTTEAIAGEKAGIIKRGCPSLCGKTDEDAANVIKNKADSVDSALNFCRYERLYGIELSTEGAVFGVRGYTAPFQIGLCGSYQPENALLCITAAELLGINEAFIRQGLKTSKWRARFEVLCRDPLTVFDGGHNPQGVKAAVKSAAALFPGKSIVVSGVMADKDYNEMAADISGVAEKVYCTEPFNSRVLPAEEYAHCFRQQGVETEAVPDVAKAVRTAFAEAKKRRLPLLILGSLYMYRQVHDALYCIEHS